MKSHSVEVLILITYYYYLLLLLLLLSGMLSHEALTVYMYIHADVYKQFFRPACVVMLA